MVNPLIDKHTAYELEFIKIMIAFDVCLSLKFSPQTSN